jgi:hypothetical protein
VACKTFPIKEENTRLRKNPESRLLMLKRC